MDDDAAARAAREGFLTYVGRASYGSHREDAVEVFGDMDFRKLMFQKTAIVHDVLSLERDVLLQDVDVIWRKDPRKYLFAGDAPQPEARFMYDGPNPLHAPLHANTGFFLLRNTARTRTVWDEVLDSYPAMLACGTDQEVVNSILGRADLSVEILPEEHFANGHLFSLGEPSRLPEDPYVVHCSWTHNLEHKLRKYRQERLW